MAVLLQGSSVSWEGYATGFLSSCFGFIVFMRFFPSHHMSCFLSAAFGMGFGDEGLYVYLGVVAGAAGW